MKNHFIACIFSVPQCGIQKPHCGIYISHCGIQIPHCETENLSGQKRVFSKEFFHFTPQETNYFFRLLFTTAGTPAARESSGISRVTTLPAAMMQRLPMVTPGQTTTLPPSQQSSPTVMG